MLRLGRFRGLQEPGLFWIVPIVDRVSAWIDHRVMVTPCTAERTLTKDTVPVDVDAVLLWLVWDAEKAALAVEDYQADISWAAQTALREIIGKMDLTGLPGNGDPAGRTPRRASLGLCPTVRSGVITRRHLCHFLAFIYHNKKEPEQSAPVLFCCTVAYDKRVQSSPSCTCPDISRWHSSTPAPASVAQWSAPTYSHTFSLSWPPPMMMGPWYPRARSRATVSRMAS